MFRLVSHSDPWGGCEGWMFLFAAWCFPCQATAHTLDCAEHSLLYPLQPTSCQLQGKEWYWEIITLQSPEVLGSCHESAVHKVWLALSTTPWPGRH